MVHPAKTANRIWPIALYSKCRNVSSTLSVRTFSNPRPTSSSASFYRLVLILNSSSTPAPTPYQPSYTTLPAPAITPNGPTLLPSILGVALLGVCFGVASSPAMRSRSNRSSSIAARSAFVTRGLRTVCPPRLPRPPPREPRPEDEASPRVLPPRPRPRPRLGRVPSALCGFLS